MSYVQLLNCGYTRCLTSCHLRFVSKSCHFFRTPLSIPWRHIQSLRDADQPVRKVPSRDGYPRRTSRIVQWTARRPSAVAPAVRRRRAYECAVTTVFACASDAWVGFTSQIEAVRRPGPHQVHRSENYFRGVALGNGGCVLSLMRDRSRFNEGIKIAHASAPRTTIGSSPPSGSTGWSDRQTRISGGVRH